MKVPLLQIGDRVVVMWDKRDGSNDAQRVDGLHGTIIDARNIGMREGAYKRYAVDFSPLPRGVDLHTVDGMLKW